LPRPIRSWQCAERDAPALAGIGDSERGYFNALIIVFLIPLALKGVSYKPLTASAMLRRNLWIYGLGGLVVPLSVSKPSTCC
jgi:hypothetical protein